MLGWWRRGNAIARKSLGQWKREGGERDVWYVWRVGQRGYAVIVGFWSEQVLNGRVSGGDGMWIGEDEDGVEEREAR